MCGGQSGGLISDIFSSVENSMNAVQTRAEAKGNAKTVRSVARVEAEKARLMAKNNAGSARAAAAENGLDVDVGSAAAIQDEFISDGAYNAAIMIQDADNNASNIRRAGSIQSNSYGLRSASSAISAGARIAGWK